MFCLNDLEGDSSNLRVMGLLLLERIIEDIRRKMREGGPRVTE